MIFFYFEERKKIHNSEQVKMYWQKLRNSLNTKKKYYVFIY